MQIRPKPCLKSIKFFHDTFMKFMLICCCLSKILKNCLPIKSYLFPVIRNKQGLEGQESEEWGVKTESLQEASKPWDPNQHFFVYVLLLLATTEGQNLLRLGKCKRLQNLGNIYDK